MQREIRKTRVDFTPGGKTTESLTHKFEGDNEIKDLLIYQVKRAVTKLFKSHLTHLEDIQQEHSSSVKKIEGLVHEDIVKMIDYFGSEKHAYYRKKVLDSGNETIRDLENLLENFEIRLRK